MNRLGRNPHRGLLGSRVRLLPYLWLRLATWFVRLPESERWSVNLTVRLLMTPRVRVLAMIAVSLLANLRKNQDPSYKRDRRPEAPLRKERLLPVLPQPEHRHQHLHKAPRLLK